MESFRVVRQWTNLLCSSHEKSRSAENIDYDVGVLEKRQLETEFGISMNVMGKEGTHHYSPVTWIESVRHRDLVKLGGKQREQDDIQGATSESSISGLLVLTIYTSTEEEDVDFSA